MALKTSNVIKTAQGFNMNKAECQSKQFSLSDPSLKSCEEVIKYIFLFIWLLLGLNCGMLDVLVAAYELLVAVCGI